MTHLLPSSANLDGFLPASACGFVGFVGRFGAGLTVNHQRATKFQKALTCSR